jgi:ribose 5-phosphate isomerase A
LEYDLVRTCYGRDEPFIYRIPGSTVPYVVERIVAQGPELNKDRVFIPTGFQSKELIIMSNLNLGDVDQFPAIDVTIDGADE